MAYLITQVHLYGESKKSDIVVADGKIREISDHESRKEVAPHTQVVEGNGAIALPGFVDIHTHLREPGYEDAETVETGTQAAARGGYTAVHAMANSVPVADTAAVVEQVYSLGKASGWAEVRPVGALTVGLEGRKLASIGSMASSAANVRIFSDDGKCVEDAAVMRGALEYVKVFDGVVAQHAQDGRLTQGAQMHEGAVSLDLGLQGWPSVAEETIIARDIMLADYVKSRLHICHVSTKGSVEIIREAKKRGAEVTAEVTPHHLMLTDECARTYDPVYKMNPPLRSHEDVMALRRAVADGTIDVIATDHAPHPAQDKEGEWAQAAMGVTGMETAVSVVQNTLVDPGLLSWRDVARIMSEKPAAIGRLGTQGRPLAVGEPAHIVLVDATATWEVDPEKMASKGRNTPFAGKKLPGRVTATFFAGRPTVLEGKLVGRNS